MVVGSAPISGTVLNFIRCAVGCLVLEGYGQTECCAPVTLTVPGDYRADHVGPPIACCCVKLADVPEMEYFAANHQGEVCVKGTNVFQGYFKNPVLTEEVKDAQGWHHTGDIGMWLPVSYNQIKGLSYPSLIACSSACLLMASRTYRFVWERSVQCQY